MTVLWCWQQRTEDTLPVYDVVICQGSGGRLERHRTLGEVAELIRRGTREVTGRETWGVCIEGTFVHNNLNTTMTLAHTQGKFEGPLERHAPSRKVLYVQPSAWRKLLFPKGYRKMVGPLGVPEGKKPMPKHYDKAAGFKFIPPRLLPLALMLQRTSSMLDLPLRKLDHGPDAGGVAEYGWLNEHKVT